ncbi:MAG: rhomboid family intramembrane serine protease [Pseudomonadales bacterium]|nr:rhomboid family intramembrane serine protease [Pseudomonadales bacterium]
MLIIPTEKRFDWKHAPLVLILIVFLNTLVFFVYQSADVSKYQQALELYGEREFMLFEWPVFREYLEQQGDFDTLSDHDASIEAGEIGIVAIHLLRDDDYYQYLSDHKTEFIPEARLDEWKLYRPHINKLLASVSSSAFGLVPNDMELITLLSYQFLHGDTMHLLGNMFFLVICGFAVEAAIGHLRFLLFYLSSGVVAGVSHAAMDLDSSSVLIGASGSVSAVMAMYLGVFRFKKIEFFYWFFIFVGYFRAPALLILPFYIGKELVQFYTEAGSNVAFMAHAGGFVAGAVLIALLLLFKRDLLNDEYIEQDQRIDPYQEQLAKVYQHFEQFRFSQAVKHLDSLIAEWGTSFDLALLRYNLLKATKPDGYGQAFAELVNLKGNSTRQLKIQEKVWLDNPAYRDHLNQDELVALGMRLATTEHLSTAEQLFHSIYKSDAVSESLQVFAQKLALLHGKLQNVDKQAYYLEISTGITGSGRIH